mmetsp:Transcript_13848/g.38942  ORF Transcript_13848/g.38942 Transcript_13848/m.38942 type:complete len:141 (-) Transcript_13848:116-538(-)
MGNQSLPKRILLCYRTDGKTNADKDPHPHKIPIANVFVASIVPQWMQPVVRFTALASAVGTMMTAASIRQGKLCCAGGKRSAQTAAAPLSPSTDHIANRQNANEPTNESYRSPSPVRRRCRSRIDDDVTRYNTTEQFHHP